MEERWIYALHSDKYHFSGWYPYWTILCKGETLEDAIARIKADNPNLKFKDFELK